MSIGENLNLIEELNEANFASIYKFHYQYLFMIETHDYCMFLRRPYCRLYKIKQKIFQTI